MSGEWAKFVADNKAADKRIAEKERLRSLVKFGVENSSNPFSKAPQGSKQHKKDILNYVNKVVADNEPKLENLKIIQDNINNKKPTYRKEVDPETFGKAAARIEKARQMSGSEMSTWDMLKKAANTPAEKKEIRKIISEDYKKNGPKDMDQDDLAWIGRGKLNPMKIKIDVEGISGSINNYVNAKRTNEPVAPPKKEIDPDLNKGLGYLLGEPNVN